MRVLETDGFHLYAAAGIRAESGLYISRDNGYTWRSTGDEHAYFYSIAIGPNSVYAGTTVDGVFRSDDRGETWKPINNAMPTITIVRAKDGSEYEALPHIRQILPTRSGRIIAVGYNSGTYISNNRGETWHNVADEWIRPGRDGPRGFPPVYIAHRIRSMTEFDGYLWVAYSSSLAFRSPDHGQSWQYLTPYGHGRVTDWAVLNDRLYVAGDLGFARWNEEERAWEYRIVGLPTYSDGYLDYVPSLTSLAVNRGRLFAGLYDHGVYMFDARSDTWIPAGLDGLIVYDLISHQSDLYAATKEGIYRASIPSIQPYSKAITTWGAVKRIK